MTGEDFLRNQQATLRYTWRRHLSTSIGRPMVYHAHSSADRRSLCGDVATSTSSRVMRWPDSFACEKCVAELAEFGITKHNK